MKKKKFKPAHNAVLTIRDLERIHTLLEAVKSGQSREEDIVSVRHITDILAERSEAYAGKAYRDRVGQYLADCSDNCRDGEIECDQNATVSEGEDDGAYVQVWMWVPRTKEVTS